MLVVHLFGVAAPGQRGRQRKLKMHATKAAAAAPRAHRPQCNNGPRAARRGREGRRGRRRDCNAGAADEMPRSAAAVLVCK